MAEKLQCRICKSSDVHRFLSLGKLPLVNSFLSEKDLNTEEHKFPLDVFFCKNCGLVQVPAIVPPGMMFKHYVYVTGVSETMKSHFSQLAADVMEKLKIQKNSLIVDIGSNDGTLLRGFKKFDVRVLGIEPAENVAKTANMAGIETVNSFFGERTAISVREKYGRAKVILGANVFGHVPRLDDFVRGADALLDRDGVFIIEVPYLVDFIKNVEFDTVYHEHHSYFAVRPLIILFRMFGMEVFEVQRKGVHGGTIRVFIRRSEGKPVHSSVQALVELENSLNLGSIETYEEFAKHVERTKISLVGLLKSLKREGKKIAGYGAAAKGNVILNYCGIGTEVIDFIADKSQLKQGLYTPGMHIPVHAPEKILQEMPDYVIILAWNFAEEIMQQLAEYKKLGGRFIVPIPAPRIV